MSAPELDLVVVGGGIQGAGVLQAAAAAGWRAALVERRELAVGTSSRSSKLIHGGLRYLESGQLRLVRESLQERAVLLRVAPELVKLVPFHLPIYRDTSRAPWKIRAGLSLYALLGGIGRDARFDRVPKDEWAGLDGLRTDGLREVFRYMDGQTDDAALTRAVAASAEELGAEVHEHTELVRGELRGDLWQLELEGSSGRRTLSCRTLVVCAGPWMPAILDRLQPSELAGQAHREVQLVAGTHIEVPGSLNHGIYYTEAPRDRRAVFSIPWRDRVMIGTTETPFRGDPATIAPTQQEIDYLLETWSHHFPSGSRDVLEAWAGLRVLPGGKGRAFHRSREVTLARGGSQLLCVYGGKLTGYRATAEQVVRHLRAGLPVAVQLEDTASLRLVPQ